MTMMGTLATNSGPIFSVNGFYQRGGALPARITTPIVVYPTTNTGQSRVAPAPTITAPPAVLHPSIITTMAPVQMPVETAPPATTAPTVTSGGGATTGAGSGSTGTTDTSRLIDLLASQFQPQAVGGSMAPVSFASTATDTSGGATAAGGSKMGLVIVVLALAGGIWYFMKHRKAKAA